MVTVVPLCVLSLCVAHNLRSNANKITKREAKNKRVLRVSKMLSEPCAFRRRQTVKQAKKQTNTKQTIINIKRTLPQRNKTSDWGLTPTKQEPKRTRKQTAKTGKTRKL